MDTKKLVNQMIEFNQTTFNNAYDSMVLMQDQFESIANKALDQTNMVPEQGRRAMESWAQLFKNSRKNIKKHIDDGFKQAEKLFVV